MALNLTNAAYQGSAAITAGGFATMGNPRALFVNCTVAGNVSVVLEDGSTLVYPVPVGATILPLAINKLNSAGTTATATYALLS